ncbi:hypothetical protein [Variovorax sp. UMC13]|uniref:hypothetical protein n=1 Tax=Variovorax sp. UMC13 TaxID=1862326 RepID=UPI0016010361|nr:hypothetical protein [Variovorax sp. UMC13]MBB1599491.1 hypothetical protein [Variovorax sp. UMC13]
MKYGNGNVERSTLVYDVDRVERLNKVLSIDVDAGIVECCHEPLQLNHDGTEVASFQLRFRSIHAIFGGCRKPTLFHCYGRLEGQTA